ncbi:MAG: hypothetical protein MGAcid_20770 [uncultured Acidilobus sp. MG]|nr:MAG: hypothetical protein MGAcid_20770 [uncultured Acidilobus sp. MG]
MLGPAEAKEKALVALPARGL